MMRQMRQNTKIIMLVTALAFVALMVFEWGMDMSGQTAGGDVGRVGSTTITAAQYQMVQRNIHDQVQRAQESPISASQNREIDEMAWNQVVNQILIQLELENRGIRVTDDEIRQAARFSPPPEFREMAEFQTEDGQFSLELYHQYLAQAANDPFAMQELERYYRETLPRNKLLRQVTAGIYVTDRELWRDFRDRNERIELQYVTIMPSFFVDDGEISVTEDEIEAYYRENRETFEVPARADIRYTWIDQTPTAADSAQVVETAESIRQEILDGMDFADLAQIESADRESAAQGGELPPFREGDRPVFFEEVAFSLPVGELSEPVRGDAGYHIIEVLSREDGEVQARHILVPFERSTDSEIRMLTRADSLESLGQNLTVEEAASQMGLPVMEGEISERFFSLPGVGIAEEGREWIFDGRESVGAVSPVFESEDSFYMFELLDRYASGILPLEQVRSEIEASIRTERKMEIAMEEARSFAQELRDGSVTLEELAEREGLVLSREGPVTRMESIPGLGVGNAAVGAAFGTPVGEVAGPVRLRDEIVLLEVLDKEEADREAWEAQKEFQRAQLTQQMRQERLQLWLDGLRETTRIVDARAEFFRQVEEQDDRPQIPLVF